MADVQHAQLPRPAGEIAHQYGDRVHILSQPYPMSLLARLSAPKIVQPDASRLVGRLYDWMLGEVSSRILKTRHAQVPTRMAAALPDAGVYKGEVIDNQNVVVVDIARAGMQPAQHIYIGLHDLIAAEQIRQDHLIASRLTGPDGQVTGIQLSTMKIGGPVNGATVLIPDPMAATGTSVSAVLDQYLQSPGGPPRAVALLHLIVTPEYLARITAAYPQVQIFAIRLDRGMSPPDILATTPGTHWASERGLNNIQYIVPGAGGIGEVLNNSWV